MRDEVKLGIGLLNLPLQRVAISRKFLIGKGAHTILVIGYSLRTVPLLMVESNTMSMLNLITSRFVYKIYQ